MSLKLRHKEDKGNAHSCLRKSISGRGNKCKGPEVRAHLECSNHSEEAASVVRAEGESQQCRRKQKRIK